MYVNMTESMISLFFLFYLSVVKIIYSSVHLMLKFLLLGLLHQTPQAALHAEEAVV